MANECDQEIVAYAYELRHRTMDEWEPTIGWDHPADIWGDSDGMLVRNVRPLVETDS